MLLKFSADASSYGLGVVLLQEIDSKWQPVAYASCTMSDTERISQHVQIEKKRFHWLGQLKSFQCTFWAEPYR